MTNADVAEQPSPGPHDDAPSVLFFGRANCPSTNSARAHLERLGFDLTYVESTGRGQKMPDIAENWTGDYIFAFRSLLIVPARILERARIAAINFHPGPPEYPGSGCVNFALYDEAEYYGVTAHIMVEKIDAGAILDVRRFKLAPADGVDSVLEHSYLTMLLQFLDVASQIRDGGADYIADARARSAHEAWRGDALRMPDLWRLQTVSPEIGAAELKRVARATYTKLYPPKLFLHGYAFGLLNPHAGAVGIADPVGASASPPPTRAATMNSAASDRKTSVLARLDLLFKRGQSSYEKYMNGGKAFIFAKALYKNNSAIHELLLINADLFSEPMRAHVVSLISHIDIWSAQWEDLEARMEPGLQDAFVFETIDPFPRDAVDALQAFCAGRGA